MGKTLKKTLLNNLGLEEISIYDLNLSSCILSKCGGHGIDSIQFTLKKKMDDIKKTGYCMWAHGNLNVEHTRNFCITEAKNGNAIYVIMPYTLSNSTLKSGGNTFNGYIVDGEEWIFPSQMNVVTGPANSKAFIFDKLYFMKETITPKDFYSLFWAVNCDGNVKSAEVSLARSCSNKCLVWKEDSSLNTLKISEKDESGILVGRLKEPYHVILNMF